MLSVGSSQVKIQNELSKMKSLSNTLYTNELLQAGKTTYCHRRNEIDKDPQNRPAFAVLVQQIPCYLTVPQLVSS
jgi:hypothetical protein